MTNTTKTDKQAYAALPEHLKAAIDNHNKRMKQFKLLDLSKVDKSKFDEFHPIHAMV